MFLLKLLTFMSMSSIAVFLFALFAVITGQSTSDSTSPYDGYRLARQSSRHLSQTEVRRVRSFAQLESAVEQLRNGGRILIEASLLRVTNPLRITQSNLQIIGADNSTTLRCPEDGGIFQLRGDGTRLENLRLLGCQSSSAISIEGNRAGGLIEFIGVTFEDNVLSAPFLNGAGLVIDRCPRGGCDELRVLMEDCEFLRNEAEVGGAVFAEDVSLEFRNCTFEGNEGRIRGGAISISRNASSLLIDDCQFQNNRVVQPLMNPFQFFGDPNGAPLETIPYWTFQFPNSAGGAVFIDTISQTEISNSTFRSNLAQAGGALGISMNVYAPNNDRTRPYSIDILDSIFATNRADYTEEYERGVISGALNTDLNLGGGIYLASSSPRLDLNFEGVVMRSNWARLGGALHLVTHPQTQPTIRNCIFDSNQAAEAGGGILVRNTGQLNIVSSNLTANSALLGGGLMLTNNAQLRLDGLRGIQDRRGTPCVFERNSANAGGGLMCSGCGPVTLQDPVFLANIAEDRGGGFFALDSDSDIGITQGVFQSNQANRGGAIAAEVTANIRISTASSNLRVLFLNNSAVDGGGAVFTRANHQRENRLRIRHAVFQSNSVSGSNASTGCSTGGGGALCLLLDSIPRSAVADYLIEETRLEGNRALVGGGAYIRVQDISWLDGGEGRSRCPEARPTTEPCRSFRFGNVNITENEAEFGAGGLFINDPESLALFCASVIPFQRQSLLQMANRVLQSNNRRLDFEQDLFCTRIQDNSVQQGEFGPDVGTAVYSLSVIDPVDGLISNHTGGDRILPPCEVNNESCTSNRSLGIQVTVLDAFQQRISGGIEDSELAVVLISDSIIGEQRYNAEEGLININNTIGVGIDADSQIQIQSTQNRSLSAGLEFTTRACLPGENASVFSCQECLPNQYSFSAQFGCRDCEDKAICPGKAALVPVEGYWHSTPFSPQFHECIVREACEYRNRLQTLTLYYSNLQSMAEELSQLDAFVAGTGTQPEYEDYLQCAEGYRGVLCGSCEDGYGHFPGGECVECPAGRSGSSLLAVLISIWTAVFLGLNIFTTLNSTKRQILMVLCQNTESSPSTLGTRSLSQRGEMPSTSERMHEDRIIAMIKVTELLKIFINYLQVTSVALSINLNWQEVIKTLLSIQGLVMGVASGSYLVPLDCSFDDNSSSSENSSGVPNSIKVLWLQVTFPLVLLVFFCLLCGTYLWIYRSKNRMEDSISFRSYFTVIAIVVVFFSYVKVTSELMRTVNCIGVDDEDEVHEYQDYAILTKKKVWAEDTQMDCFEGDHTLTGVFGVLGLIFFSLMVILFILFWLPLNSHRLKEPEFIAQYGFIYQGYKEEWYLTSWEAIIAIRKALIAAAVVFAFPLGPNLQGVCALGVIILAIAVHFVFSPFKRFKGHPNVPSYAGHWLRIFGFQRIANWWVLLNNSISLNAMESASLLMSMIVFYSGILFNDENTSEGGKHTMAAFTFIVNVTFVVYVLYRLYSGAHVTVNLSCEQLKGIAPSLIIPDGNGVLAFLKKMYLILINRNVLDNHMRSMTMKPSPLQEHI